MIHYDQLQYRDNLSLWNAFAAWFNKIILRFIVIRTAWNIHQGNGREIHVFEIFNSYYIMDGRERDDINRSGKLGKMRVNDALKASIWNSTAHEKMKKTKSIIEYPLFN